MKYYFTTLPGKILEGSIKGICSPKIYDQSLLELIGKVGMVSSLALVAGATLTMTCPPLGATFAGLMLLACGIKIFVLSALILIAAWHMKHHIVDLGLSNNAVNKINSTQIETILKLQEVTKSSNDAQATFSDAMKRSTTPTSDNKEIDDLFTKLEEDLTTKLTKVPRNERNPYLELQKKLNVLKNKFLTSQHKDYEELKKELKNFKTEPEEKAE